MKAPAVQIQHVTKCFAKVVANKDVSITVNDGEVLALLGENGAGKSTIMKILYGLYGLDEGTILVRGEEVKIKSPADAMARGISMIQQHFALVPTHTAAENIILGNVRGTIALKEYEEKLAKIAGDYGFDVPMDVPVGELAVGQQQKIEILKALYINANILIMDEPTAVLTPQESETLMQFIRDFTAKGNSIVFITHKMKEVMEVADRIVVMRNGVVVDEVSRDKTNEKELARLMIGQDIEVTGREEHAGSGTEVLTLTGVSLTDRGGVKLLEDVSLAVHEGEIFGIAGVSGNGQDELCDVISGVKSPSAGEVLLDGKDITHASIRERNGLGLGYVPVDRYRDGMIMDMTLSENVLLKHCFDKSWFRKGFINQKKLNDYTNALIQNHYVKASDCFDTAGSLSGGNQQKVVLGREVDLGKRLLVLNQPTRGLDMGAVARIHNVIMQEKENGKAVLVISTELSEIFEICDRIGVMHGGKLMGIYPNGALSTAQIGLLMAGVPYETEVSKA